MDFTDFTGRPGATEDGQDGQDSQDGQEDRRASGGPAGVRPTSTGRTGTRPAGLPLTSTASIQPRPAGTRRADGGRAGARRAGAPRTPGARRPGRRKVMGCLLGLFAVLVPLLGCGSTTARVTSPAALPDPKVYGAAVFRGWALDTCKTPTLATLRAWHASRYRAVGVYYAGQGRTCRHQPRLTRAWARGATALGWHLLPIYVGSQSPCVRNKKKKRFAIHGDPAALGRAEARAAVSRAKALGLQPRSALYLDVEAYDQQRTGCARTTLAYVRGWSAEARAHGYFAGFYSSAASGVREVSEARSAGLHQLPSAVWFARWHTKPSLYAEPVLPPQAWSPHRRIHQYAGNVHEKHGGRKLTIDRSKVDAPVAIVG